ncbi:hypothetical protein [Streptomyces sp. HGB0020]|uniref:hypothetical protein n=1 Tax=Streptomyces sp. HGB0020 TaxID=1078086 RepID=UPI00034E6AC0|nr:hypothetical protein [Streptomyces sp. HGB0020]EPD63600.1 hypothetical protein HMPREF1211_02727 [Streptomyces sp. HGB0020]
MSADSTLEYIDIAMILVGAGLDLNLRTIMPTMQNAVSSRDIGVATSSTTFFQQMGGTIGVAVFLSVTHSLVPDKIAGGFKPVQHTAAFEKAAAAHPDRLKMLNGSNTDALDDTSFLSKLDSALAHPFKVGFTDSRRCRCAHTRRQSGGRLPYPRLSGRRAAFRRRPTRRRGSVRCP